MSLLLHRILFPKKHALLKNLHSTNIILRGNIVAIIVQPHRKKVRDYINSILRDYRSGKLKLTPFDEPDTN